MRKVLPRHEKKACLTKFSSRASMTHNNRHCDTGCILSPCRCCACRRSFLRFGHVDLVAVAVSAIDFVIWVSTGLRSPVENLCVTRYEYAAIFATTPSDAKASRSLARGKTCPGLGPVRGTIDGSSAPSLFQFTRGLWRRWWCRRVVVPQSTVFRPRTQHGRWHYLFGNHRSACQRLR